MHFWIDKRSQNCAFSGRPRVPPSLARRRKYLAGSMVTPVHRFQPIESIREQSSRRNSRRRRDHSSEFLRRQARERHREAETQLNNLNSNLNIRNQQNSRDPSPINVDPNVSTCNNNAFLSGPSFNGSVVHSARGGAHVELSNGNANTFLDLSTNDSATNNACASRTMLFNNNGTESPPRVPLGRLKCNMWAGFAFAAMFVIGLKILYDQQTGVVGGPELGYGYSILAIIVLSFFTLGCCVSFCRRKTPDYLIARTSCDDENNESGNTRNNDANEQRSSDFRQVRVSQSQPNIQEVMQPGGIPRSQSSQHTLYLSSPTEAWAAPLSPISDHAGDPPPYHIAVLLPQPSLHIILPRQESTETPPPSYEKATS